MMKVTLNYLRRTKYFSVVFSLPDIPVESFLVVTVGVVNSILNWSFTCKLKTLVEYYEETCPRFGSAGRVGPLCLQHFIKDGTKV